MWLWCFLWPWCCWIWFRGIQLTIWMHPLKRCDWCVFVTYVLLDLLLEDSTNHMNALIVEMCCGIFCDLVLLDLLPEWFNLPYECTHWGDVFVVFFVTLVLLVLLLEGFSLPSECTHWGDVIVVFFVNLGVAGFASRGFQLTIWKHSLRRCDCCVFDDLGVAGFASRGIQLIIWMH